MLNNNSYNPLTVCKYNSFKNEVSNKLFSFWIMRKKQAFTSSNPINEPIYPHQIHMLKHTHTHTPTYTLSLSLSLSYSLCQSLSLSHTHTHEHTRIHTHIFFLLSLLVFYILCIPVWWDMKINWWNRDMDQFQCAYV